MLQRTRISSSSGSASADSFSVLQMNLLADGLHNSFTQASPDQLHWASRYPRILRELVVHSPDILCLQEINHLDDFKRELAKAGFQESLFQPKRPSPCSKFGAPEDGTAIFWKSKNLQLVRSERQQFRNSSQGWCAVLLKFLNKQQEAAVWIFTTHLKAKEGNEQVRIAQLNELLDVIRKKCEEFPVIVCGDFNSMPDNECYDLMMQRGFISCYTYVEASVQNKSPETLSCQELRSFENSWTTWKIRAAGEKKATIDYIWIRRRIPLANLEVIPKSILRMPNESEIPPERLPCSVFPSDHMSLFCEFEIHESND